MYYHILSELGVEAANRLQLQEERICEEEGLFNNCGKMSLHDSLRELHLTEKRIMDFVYDLHTKINEVGMSPLVSIPFISKSLNVPEDMVITILQKNGLELTTVEEEIDEY